MANNTDTTTVKTEFVNVVTEGELVSSPISATFSTIITEASLVEIPLPEGQINEKTIATLYVFVDAMSYRAFTENKLRPWENALEYKHFDTMYMNHRSLVNTIKKLHQQAQALLEEANILTGRDFMLHQEIKTHISKITRTELCKRLCKPGSFVSKKCLFLPLHLKHQPHHLIYRLVDIVSDTWGQENPWDVMNAIVFPTSSGTVNDMSVPCVDKDNQDMPKRIVLTITMTMEPMAISI